LTEVSLSTIVNLKKTIDFGIEKVFSNEHRMIGGPGVAVQVYETVLWRRGLIMNLTSTSENLAGARWLVGGIEEGEEKRFFIEIVPNCRISTLVDLFSRRISPGSIIKIDGHPSYPSVCSNLGFSHIIVNHSIGFTMRRGTYEQN
jgi:hypothetical protein